MSVDVVPRAGTGRRHHRRLRIDLNIIKRQIQYQNVGEPRVQYTAHLIRLLARTNKRPVKF